MLSVVSTQKIVIKCRLLWGYILYSFCFKKKITTTNSFKALERQTKRKKKLSSKTTMYSKQTDKILRKCIDKRTFVAYRHRENDAIK